MLPSLLDLLGLSGLKFLPQGPEESDFSAAIKRGRGRPNHRHADVDPAAGPWPPGYFHDYYACKVGSGRRDYDRAVSAVSSWQHADSLPWVSTNRPRLPLPLPLPLPLGFSFPRRGRRKNDDETDESGLVIAARAAGPFLPFLPLWIVNPLKIVEVRKEGGARGGVPALGGGGKENSKRQKQKPASRRPLSRAPGRSFSVKATTCSSHVLAGAESFSVFLNENGEEEGEKGVWFEVASFSRPAAALPLLTLPLVRVLQAKFREESARAVARAVREGKK